VAAGVNADFMAKAWVRAAWRRRSSRARANGLLRRDVIAHHEYAQSVAAARPNKLGREVNLELVLIHSDIDEDAYRQPCCDHRIEHVCWSPVQEFCCRLQDSLDSCSEEFVGLFCIAALAESNNRKLNSAATDVLNRFIRLNPEWHNEGRTHRAAILAASLQGYQDAEDRHVMPQ